jgi:predicted nucleic acid-binding protein
VTGWLLDTHVLSELRRPKPEPKVVSFVAAQSLDRLYVSAITLAEIRFGIELVADATKRGELNDWLAHKARPMFDQRVLPVSEDVIFKWRLMVEDGRRAGHTYSQPDLMIGATALLHGLTVVTRDTSDFEMARVPVLNPWKGPHGVMQTELLGGRPKAGSCRQLDIHDRAKGRQGKLRRVPNEFGRHVLVVMAVDGARPGHALPCNRRITALQRRRQAA